MRESERIRRLGKNRVVLAIDSQALQSFQTCSKQYYLSKAENLVPLRTKKAYEIGSMVHEIMHRITRAKLNRREFNMVQLLEIGYKVIRRAHKTGVLVEKKTRTRNNQEEPVDPLAFHTTRFTEFFAWNMPMERFYKPLGSEVGFSKVLFENMDVIFVYEGRIDSIIQVEPAGFRTWIDYKTQSREYQIYANRNQFLGYSWALGSTIGFMLYYGLQKEKGENFRYQTIHHNKELIKQWVSDTTNTYKAIMTRIPFGANAFERNRAGCDSGKFGLCPFTILCDNAWASAGVQRGLRANYFKESEWTPWK